MRKGSECTMDLATLFSIIVGVPTILGFVCVIIDPIEITREQFVYISVILIIIILAVAFFANATAFSERAEESTGAYETTAKPAPELETEVNTGTESLVEDVEVQIFLSQCEFVDDSNKNGSTSDVCVDNWVDVFDNYRTNSIKFWVIDSPEWNNSEHITYRLGGQYETLSGTIVAEQKCDPGSRFVFTIYIDNTLVYKTETITTAEIYNFSYDITGANEIRIVCSTDTPYSGYCIFDATVS